MTVAAWLVTLGILGLPGAGRGDVETIGRLDHPPIREASGLVASRRYPGVFWVHNDSGNPPALFAVRRDGSLIQEFSVAAPNLDWEDLAIDDAGHLWIGDIGNNGQFLPLRVVYRLDEPDPFQPSEAPLPVGLAIHYRFGSDGRFDAESLVVDGSRLLVISKRLDGGEPGVYALPSDRPAPLLAPANLAYLGTIKGFTGPATAADLSADGRRLAVASYTQARVYERVGETRWLPIGGARYTVPGVEAIAWDGPDLILASEGRGIYRIAESVWRTAAPGRGDPLPTR